MVPQDLSPYEDSRLIGHTLRTADKSKQFELVQKLANKALEQMRIPTYRELFGDEFCIGGTSIEHLCRTGVLQRYFRDSPSSKAAADLIAACSRALEVPTITSAHIADITHFYAGLGENDRRSGYNSRVRRIEAHERTYGTKKQKEQRWEQQCRAYEDEISSGKPPELAKTDAAEKCGVTSRTIARALVRMRGK